MTELFKQTHSAILQLSQQREMIKLALDQLDDTIANLERNVKAASQVPTAIDMDPMPPVSEHRRLHRSGKQPKIDSDPELLAFIAARIDRMTFHELATAVKQAFPEPRRVGRSAIHAWWQRQRK